MILSVLKSEYLTYPENNYFSPHIRYPEYLFSHISNERNLVYESVRRLLYQSELDSDNYGTQTWNPLGKYIKKGARVFIMPNFVYHKRTIESIARFMAKCTHVSILRAIIDYVLIACGSEGKVMIGNAPLQAANFNKLINDTRINSLIEFYKSNGIDIAYFDLRTLILEEKNFSYYINIKRNSENELAVNLAVSTFIRNLAIVISPF